MDRSGHTLKAAAGFSLLELILATMFASVLSLGIWQLLQSMQTGLTSIEVHNGLKMGGQQSLNQIHQKLAGSQHIFFSNSPDGPAFQSHLQLSPAPPALAGSALPALVENGPLSPNDPAWVTVVGGNSVAGNSLLFTRFLSSCAVTVQPSGGGPSQNFRMDILQFDYFYLAEEPQTRIGGISKRALWEWRSIPYADYRQINAIADSTAQSQAVEALQNMDQHVQNAWDPSGADIDHAFYSFDAGGGVSGPVNNPSIQKAFAAPMIIMLTGISAGGYIFGTSPNTGAGLGTADLVPQFAAANGDFPSGFEVVIVGPPAAREVFMRLVLIAKGSFNGLVSNATTVLSAARDL